MNRLFFSVPLALALTVSAEAHAQTKSMDGKTSCAGKWYAAAAHRYLTGKGSSDGPIATTETKRLEIDGKSVSGKVEPKSTTAFVSIPFTALSVFANFLVQADKPIDQLVVCHFALKSSAKSWASFEPGDLQATEGRVLQGIKANESVKVRLGGSAAPEGYRPSTVALAFIGNGGSEPMTATVTVKSAKK
jgi:hypothetical protein